MAGDFVGVRIEGGLLPTELLSRLSTGKGSGEVGGLSSADYGLAHGETVREAANRVWAYLTTVWTSYRNALAELPDTDRATTLTRDRWLQIMLDQLGYGRVPVAGAGGIRVVDKSFPISHLWGQVPVHLLGERIELDRRTAGVAGAAGQAPQSLVQELLNRSDEHLWAILSNGSTLRLLRDSTSLVGSAYVEFDLEAIFDGELFSDFLLLYTLCHSSRLAVRDEELGPASCWLESWREVAFESGSRALEQLRQGVVEALETLGSGFLGHPDNAALRHRVESGELALSDYNHSLLRVVYRLLFAFVAEDRGALLSPEADVVARQRYHDYFSTDRLRRTSRRRRGGRHSDRWRALQLVWAGLGSTGGRPELGIAGIGGLYEVGELDILGSASLSNESLLKAVRSLSVITEKQSGFKRVVDHRNLGAEELGSIYESLLEYVPSWDAAVRAYRLGDAAGNARKTTGSYYTPTSLIESLLDTALDPVLDEAEKSDYPDAALLGVTVCDPACGSGHFLVGAARRIAKRVAKIRTGDPEPPPEQVRSALREVVGRCIYGVDVNPLAAELAKVSLWLEAMEPGKPLAFLDAQIKVGNALVGVTPALLDAGIPQEAFKPIEGDDRKIAAGLARRNRDESGGQTTFFDTEEIRFSNAALVERAQGLVGTGLSLADVHVQQQRLKAYLDSDAYRHQRLLADAWSAAFVWPKTADAPTAVTNGTLDRLFDGSMADDQRHEVERLAAEYRFFHWHLEYPHIFPTDPLTAGGSTNSATGWYGGFSVVLGNPPYLDSEALSRDEPRLRRFLDVNYASTRGNWDLYVPFVELARNLTRPLGFFGQVTPNKIMGVSYVESLQSLLLEENPLSCHDFSSLDLFEGASVRIAILCNERREVDDSSSFTFVEHQSSGVSKVTRSTVGACRSRPSGFAFSGDPGPLIFQTLSTQLGDLARCSDGASTGQAYEIREILSSNECPDHDREFKLINTGTIDPFQSLWGQRMTRYLGTTELFPVIPRLDLQAIAPKRVAQADHPKVVLGGLGSRIEAFADHASVYLCGKSAVLILPQRGVCSFAIAAWLNAPMTTAYYRAFYGNQGFGSNSVSFSPKQVARIPVPNAEVLRCADHEGAPKLVPSAVDAMRAVRLDEPVLSMVGAALHDPQTQENAWSGHDLDLLVTTVIEHVSTSVNLG